MAIERGHSSDEYRRHGLGGYRRVGHDTGGVALVGTRGMAITQEARPWWMQVRSNCSVWIGKNAGQGGCIRT